MRISDWSSDVCSSDLSRADTGKGGQSLLDDKTRGTAGDFQRSLRARRTLDAISAVRIAPGGLTMQRYYVLDREMAAGEDGFEAMVARAYRLTQAVRCLCRRDIPLILSFAHPNCRHVLLTWPGTRPP